MNILLAAIAPRRSKAEPEEQLLADYTARIARYEPTDTHLFDTEAALLERAERRPGRVPAILVLLDSRGRQFSSEEFATYFARLRDEGTQRVVFAIGPADGWSAETRNRAHLLWSLGRITLPHQLARVVMAEQLYRALTILAGHPYHSGH